MDLDALVDEWSKDAEIDSTEPGRELLKIPKLHSKYLKILTHHSMLTKKYGSDYAQRKKILFEYYQGDLNNPDDLKRYGLEPWVKKTLRQDIQVYLDADQTSINLLLKKAMQEEIVEFCKAVIKELGARTWQIRSYIEYEKFISGN